MVEKFRHRLIGAIVWIALAVIFIPAIFDGAGYHSLTLSYTGADPSGKLEFEVKPRSEAPQVDFKTTHKKLNLPPSERHEAEQDTKPAPDSSFNPVQSERKSGEAAVEVKAADDASKAAQKTPRSAAKPRPPGPPPSPEPDQTLRQQASGPWFIKRVRTYNDKNSASVFIKRLRQAGYPAYLDVAVSSERTRFAVSIGPIEGHDFLEEVKAYLAAQLSIHGIEAQAAG